MQLDLTYEGTMLKVPVGESADGEAKGAVSVKVLGTVTILVDTVPVLLFVHRHIKKSGAYTLSHWESGKSLGVIASSVKMLLAEGLKAITFNRDEATGLLHMLRCAAFDDHLNDLPKDDEL